MRRTFLAVAACAILIGSLSSTLSANPLRVVALSGMPVPGMPAGVTFTGVGTPQIDASGRVAFSGSIAGDGIRSTNDGGLWIERNGALQLVVREGDLAPGFVEPQLFVSVWSSGMNRRGDLVVGGVVSYGGLGHRGLWKAENGTLTHVAHEGMVMSQSGALIWQISSAISLSDGGQIAFADQRSFQKKNGVWALRDGELDLVALQNSLAPDLPGDRNYMGFGFPTINRHGDVAYFAYASGGSRGIFESRGGSTRAVAYSGMPAPGAGGEAQFNRFLVNNFTDAMAPAYNDSGQFAFAASLRGANVADGNDTGLWAGSPESFQLIAREGDQAPGLPEGVVFADMQRDDTIFTTRAVINDEGRVYFSTFLQDPDGARVSSMWTTRDGVLTLIARGGDVGPGVTGNVLFSLMYPPFVNASGRVAFRGSFRDPITGAAGGFGIWAEDATGTLRCIAQQGTLLEVAPGDFRTIQFVNFTDQTDYQNRDKLGGSGFNDRGEVAFLARFTDGSSGAFVSSVAAVPEPASWILVAVVTTCVRGRRSR